MSISPCAACKYMRRKCTKHCVFAPYFPANKHEQYEAVHKAFGASHVATLLNQIRPSERESAMNSLAFEAKAHLRDPVCGYSRLICLLQRQLQDLQAQLKIAKKELADIAPAATFQPPLHPNTYQQNHHHHDHHSQDWSGNIR